MKKLLFLLVCTLALCAIAVPVARASDPPAMPPVLSEASGVWMWTYVDDGYEWVDDFSLPGWFFASNTQERGIWSGTFSGTSIEPWVFYVDPDGDLWAMITIHFVGTVHGRYGKATIALTVASEDPLSGQWSVIRGRGGLRDLHGLGTWVWTRDEGVYSYADYYGAVWWQ
jgi:hypothetical protein